MARASLLANATSTELWIGGSTMAKRKYFLDWLRVLAFAALIIFHVGMLYVSWDYNLKSPRLYPGLEPWMTALSPWRLALMFVISGVASRFLIERLGPGAFARDRLLRLIPVILTGMYVVIPPQTYVALAVRGIVQTDFPTFWWTQYLRANQTLVAPLGMTLPTWDHLWFLVYLLVYTVLAAGIASVGRRVIRREIVIPVWALLLAPPVWLVCTNLLILTAAPITHALVNDWGGHLKWGGLFLSGFLAARQDQFWDVLQKHRGTLLVVATGLFLVQTQTNDPVWSAVSGLYAWAAICTLIGFAKYWLDQPSFVLSHLNEAVLPIYVLHQPILLIAAFWLFPMGLPVQVEAAILIALTGFGALMIYELLIRPITVLRFLFGLKAKASVVAA